MNFVFESLKSVLQDQFGPAELCENGCPSCSAEGPVMKAGLNDSTSQEAGRREDGGLGYLIVFKIRPSK